MELLIPLALLTFGLLALLGAYSSAFWLMVIFLSITIIGLVFTIVFNWLDDRAFDKRMAASDDEWEKSRIRHSIELDVLEKEHAEVLRLAEIADNRYRILRALERCNRSIHRSEQCIDRPTPGR